MTLQSSKQTIEVGIISDNVEGFMYDITQKILLSNPISNHCNNELNFKTREWIPTNYQNVLTQR
jgi:hypothetical protein